MQNRNFSGKTNLILPDQSFYKCNFAQPKPQFSGGKWRGIKIFANNTPRVFIECNLCNVEPPSGSLVQGCLTIIKRSDVSENDNVFDIFYGFWNENIGDYEYFGIPKKKEVSN